MGVSVSFTSSHVGGDFSSGRLDIELAAEDERVGLTHYDAVWFEVPRDFHTHNDSVAAALMTLVAQRYHRVRFNFPISTYCAETLRTHYKLAEVGPVDASLEPRRRGTQLGLMFSGGLDSLAMWVLLNRMLGEGNFRVITTDFGEGYAFEARGYRAIPRDVTCRTNFRELGYDVGGRFTGAVPLLFADYLDLDSVITGHHGNHPPADMAPLIDGREPLYLSNDPPFLAGGLGEVHLARALFAPATPWILVQSDPALLEAGWLGSATEGSVKQFKKGLLLRHLFKRAGKPLPEWLAQPLVPPRRAMPLKAEPDTLGMTYYLVKHCGVAALRPLFINIDRYDLSFVNDLALTFLDRYNPNVTSRLPLALQVPALDALHHYGIYPYDERDWHEYHLTGELIQSARVWAVTGRDA